MLTLHSYGFFIGLGIVAGLLVVEKVKEKFPDTRYPSFGSGNSTRLIQPCSKPDPSAGRQIPVNCLLFWLVIFGLVGARLYHVVDYWQYYSENPIEIFYLWQGGMGIYGAIAGGFVGLWAFLKLKVKSDKLKSSSRQTRTIRFSRIFLSYLDLISFGLPVAQAIGRLGNYFNQELYGLPTNLLWGIYINLENRLPGYEGFSYFQPLFAFEAVWNIIIFIILITIINIIKKPKPGIFFFTYLGLYGFGRFWLEFLRINPWEIGGINTAQGISLGLVIISLFWFMRHKLIKM